MTSGSFNIQEVNFNFPSQDVIIAGENMKRIPLHVYPKITTTEDLIRLNETGAILLRRGIVVHPTPNTTYESKGILTSLIAHGEVSYGTHILVGGIPSYEFYQKASAWLKKNKLPPIDFFASCDDRHPSGLTTRWDQFTQNPVIGIAGKISFLRIEGSKLIVDSYLDKHSGINPFTIMNRNHPKRRLIEVKFNHRINLTK